MDPSILTSCLATSPYIPFGRRRPGGRAVTVPPPRTPLPVVSRHCDHGAVRVKSNDTTERVSTDTVRDSMSRQISTTTIRTLRRMRALQSWPAGQPGSAALPRRRHRATSRRTRMDTSVVAWNQGDWLDPPPSTRVDCGDLVAAADAGADFWSVAGRRGHPRRPIRLRPTRPRAASFHPLVGRRCRLKSPYVTICFRSFSSVSRQLFTQLGEWVSAWHQIPA